MASPLVPAIFASVYVYAFLSLLAGTVLKVIAPGEITAFLEENAAFLGVYVFVTLYLLGLVSTFILGCVLSIWIQKMSKDGQQRASKSASRGLVYVVCFSSLFLLPTGTFGQVIAFILLCFYEYVAKTFQNHLRWADIPDEIREDAKRIIYGKNETN